MRPQESQQSVVPWIPGSIESFMESTESDDFYCDLMSSFHPSRTRHFNDSQRTIRLALLRAAPVPTQHLEELWEHRPREHANVRAVRTCAGGRVLAAEVSAARTPSNTLTSSKSRLKHPCHLQKQSKKPSQFQELLQQV